MFDQVQIRKLPGFQAGLSKAKAAAESRDEALNLQAFAG
jgi:hypothetical protein